MPGSLLVFLFGIVIGLGFGLVFCRILCPARRGVIFGYRVGPVSRKERSMPLEVQITNEQKVDITVNPQTLGGQPAPLHGPITTEVISGDSTISTIDDRSFFLVSSDTPGDTMVLISGDADLGDGVVLVQDTIRLTVLGALAANLGLVAGTPQPK